MENREEKKQTNYQELWILESHNTQSVCVCVYTWAIDMKRISMWMVTDTENLLARAKKKVKIIQHHRDERKKNFLVFFGDDVVLCTDGMFGVQAIYNLIKN